MFPQDWGGRPSQLGWQTGTFQQMPRYHRLGWPENLQFQSPHLFGNNTFSLILPT